VKYLSGHIATTLSGTLAAGFHKLDTYIMALIIYCTVASYTVSVKKWNQ